MGWDRHKLLWDGTYEYVPWTTRVFSRLSFFAFFGYFSGYLGF